MAAKDAFKPLTAELDALLKPRGFAKSGLMFCNTSIAAVVRQVVVEPFCFNTAQFRRFQLVVGLYLLTGETGEFAFHRRPGRYSLAFQIADGALNGNPGVYCEIPPDPGDPAFLTAFRAGVTNAVLPILEQATSAEGVIAVAEEAEARAGARRHSVPLAIALARLGRMNIAKTLFKRGHGDPATIREIASRHGIVLEP
jgi:hypothetical protein